MAKGDIKVGKNGVRMVDTGKVGFGQWRFISGTGSPAQPAPAKKKRVLKKVAPAMHRMGNGKMMTAAQMKTMMKAKGMPKKPMLGQYP